MAKRTRNHILEDESRLFFKKSLPDFWVCRDKTDDYGIDCEVEIFNEKGLSTGLVFWVQLKGTDEVDEKKIKKIPFDKDKIRQFIDYDIPVLIVRYSSHRTGQFVKWAKSIRINKNTTKSFGVQFYESELWNEDTNMIIKSYLENQNFIKRGLVRFPIRTSIYRKEYDHIDEIPYSNVSIIKQCLGSQPKYFILTSDPKGASLHLKVGDDFLLTSFSDLALASMSLTFDDIRSEHVEKLTKYVLITVCHTLYDIGKNNMAEQIIFGNDLLPIIMCYKEFLIGLLPNLLAGDRSSEVLEILNEYFRQNTDDNIIEIATQILLLVNKRTSQHAEAIEEFLKIQLDISRERKHNIGIATALYNLGNFYRNENRLVQALENYLEARKYNSNYKNKAYYYYELAGVLFLLDKFYFSSKFYERAIQLKTDYPYAKALCAHALLHLGKYETSLDLIDIFLKEQGDNNEVNIEEWQLWNSCLQTLLEAGYPKNQLRDTLTSNKFVEEKNYSEAVEWDLLNALAWFNLGVQQADNKDNHSAFLAFTFAGLLFNGDLESWVNATILGLSLSEEKYTILLIYIVRTAYNYNGFEYINLLQEKIKKQSPQHVSVILELIDDTIKERKKEPTIIRIFNENDDFEQIVI